MKKTYKLQIKLKITKSLYALFYRCLAFLATFFQGRNDRAKI